MMNHLLWLKTLIIIKNIKLDIKYKKDVIFDLVLVSWYSWYTNTFCDGN